MFKDPQCIIIIIDYNEVFFFSVFDKTWITIHDVASKWLQILYLIFLEHGNEQVS